MTQGLAGRGLACGLLGLVVVGCGPEDPDPEMETRSPPKMGAATPDCGTVQEPLVFTLTDVKPAAGSSVPNVDVVQSFTIVGKLIQLQPTFAHAAAHTAGGGMPSPLTWTVAASGGNSVYTTLPMSWTTAPAHVELNAPGLVSTDDGCVFVLPTPTFSYDITAP